jgi:co-chaperonin GroES (HSP10)
MKPGPMLFAAALALMSLPLSAQQASASGSAAQSSTVSTSGVAASQSANANTQSGPASAQANGSASANGEMRPVNTELMGKLDSKSAKAGDQVVVKTTQKIQTADGLVIPKGSRLVGHVAEVQAHGSGQADSAMSLVFDHAELKGGQSVAIYSVIETVAPPVNAMAASSLDSDSSFATAAPAGGGRSGGGRLGGGLVGGTLSSTSSLTGSATSNLGETAAGAGSTVTSSTSGAVHSTAAVAGGATAGVGAATGTAGALTAHATGIPGVMLAGNASGSASGTLTASRRNIHLDSGTQMVMGLSGAVAR